MPYRLDENIVELTRRVVNERVIMNVFEEAYGEHQERPKSVYRTMLCCRAVSFNHKDLVRYLLENGYDINYSCVYYSPSPLNVAVHLGRDDCIEMLLNAGARVDTANRFIEGDNNMSKCVPALELAVMMDRVDLVKLMIPLYDRTRTWTQRTPLHFACLHGSRKCLDYILSTAEGQDDVNAVDSDDTTRHPEGYSPLMLGLHHGAWLVQRMIQAGGHATHVTSESKCNVLHIACSSSMRIPHDLNGFVPSDLPKIIELLVESGCDPNISSASGETALSELCSQVVSELGCPQFVPFPYEVTLHGEIVLSAVSLLLEHGANPDGDVRHIPLWVLISQLRSILHQCASMSVVPTMLERSLPSVLRATILCRDFSQLLLLHGANPDIKDFHGHICRRIIDSLLDLLLTTWNVLMGQSQWRANIVSIIADIFRLLLLFGGKLHKPELVFQVFIDNIPGGSLFLTYYLNFCGKREIELQMKDVLVRLKNASDTRLAELRGFLQRQPILLMNLARIAILRCVGSRAVHAVPTLELPTSLTDYILSLK